MAQRASLRDQTSLAVAAATVYWSGQFVKGLVLVWIATVATAVTTIAPTVTSWIEGLRGTMVGAPHGKGLPQ